MSKKADVHHEYKCPICTFSKSHIKNHEFVHCNVHKKPICISCASILLDLTEKKEEPTSFFYELSKKLTNLSFKDFKKEIYTQMITEHLYKLNAPEEERTKFISDQRKHTWQTEEEVIESWKNAVKDYSSLLKELK